MAFLLTYNLTFHLASVGIRAQPDLEQRDEEERRRVAPLLESRDPHLWQGKNSLRYPMDIEDSREDRESTTKFGPNTWGYLAY
jgi:hypothetical protein